MRGFVVVAVLAGLAGAAIVDRIAVSVGNRVITDSEIDQRLRLTAFQNAQKVNMSGEARKQAAERLIDQRIVEREMDVGHFPRHAEGKGKELVDGWAKENFNADAEAMGRALTRYGLGVRDLEIYLLRQSDLLTFLSLRFRPAVQVSDQEVQQYFRDKIQPKNPGANMNLNNSRAEIERQLTNDRADSDLEAWLQDQRGRVHIEYHEEDLK